MSKNFVGSRKYQVREGTEAPIDLGELARTRRLLQTLVGNAGFSLRSLTSVVLSIFQVKSAE